VANSDNSDIEALVKSELSLPPGPPRNWPGGDFKAMRNNGAGHLLSLVKKYGDVCRFHLGPQPVVVVRQPEHVRQVLIEKARQYSKETRGFQKLAMILGQGLVTSSGELWRKQRRIMQPAFHRKQIADFAEIMGRISQEAVEKLRPYSTSGEVIDIDQAMMGLTLEVVSEALLGEHLENEADLVADAVEVVQQEVNRRIMSVVDLPMSVPTRSNLRLKNAFQDLDKVVHGLIAKRREAGVNTKDLLSMLLQVKDADTGEGMNDQQLRDEVMTMFLAGHETSSNALVWTWHLLSRNPAVARKLKAELDEVLGGRAPTLDDLPKLVYTEKVLHESMRLFPPVWGFSRMAEEEDVIGGYRIPKGTWVFVSQYLTHRIPEYFENPEGFDPDRFHDGFMESLPKCTYFPFGAGARQCIGNNFALMEIKIILATLAQQFQFFLEEGHSVVAKPLITLRPLNGLRMRVVGYPGAESPAKA
jgi:cytochrome P450